MTFSIAPSDDGTYIVLKIVGNINSEIAMKHNIEAHALGNKLGITRYLVDVTESRNVASIAENYKFAHNDMKTTPGINQTARVAVLVSPTDHSHDFIETLSRNAGLNTTIFRDREKAIQHLMK
jgi:5-methylcytosine-specific restriction endonuclease McrBC regulatory subunit McrC